MNFSFPALACDIGGTNVRIARKENEYTPLSEPVFLKTHDFASLQDAILAARGIREGVRSVIVCGAGPVIGRCLQLTNAPWLIDGQQVAKVLDLDQGLLLNDFEAQALSLPAIQSEWHHEIKSGKVRSGPSLILGPGTGLGIGALVNAGGRYLALASEACHVDFAPAGREQELIWPHLERVNGRITTESVMSGAGLARLHRARLIALNLPDLNCTAAMVGERACEDPTSQEAETVRLFWEIIARFAGDMAITFLATGGVTLAGGILPRLTPLLQPERFSQAFEAKAPVDNLARSICVRLITESQAVLYGMAAILATPSSYQIDYSARAWR